MIVRLSRDRFIWFIEFLMFPTVNRHIASPFAQKQGRMSPHE